jgi:hypothetical protein
MQEFEELGLWEIIMQDFGLAEDKYDQPLIELLEAMLE